MAQAMFEGWLGAVTRAGTRLMSGVGLTQNGCCHGTHYGRTHGKYLPSMR